MPIQPIKSAITANPTNKDTSVCIRSMRGNFINPLTDQVSKLVATEFHTVFSSNNIIKDVGNNLLTSVPAAIEYTFTGPGPGFSYCPKVKLNAGVNAYNNLFTRIALLQQVGKTHIARFRAWMRNFQGCESTFSASIGLSDCYPSTPDYIWKQSPGLRLRRTVSPSSDIVYLDRFLSGTTFSIVQQSNWNIDTLQTSDDIAKNPSRCQIDWDKPFQLVLMLDLPFSAIVGFFYDGIFLPAHRFYLEDEASFSFLSSRLSPCWLMQNDSGGTVPASPPEIDVYGCSLETADLSGENPVRLNQSSDIVTVAAGETRTVLSLSSLVYPSLSDRIIDSVELYSDTEVRVRCCYNAHASYTLVNPPPNAPDSYDSIQINRGLGATIGRTLTDSTFSGNHTLGNFGVLGRLGRLNGVLSQSCPVFDVVITNSTGGDARVNATLHWHTED